MLERWFNLRKKNPLADVRSYALFYGYPTDTVLRQLTAFDLAAIEPHSYTAGQIAELRLRGTRAIGYISVMETPKWNVRRAELLENGDYLRLDGRRRHFPEWDSYLMDLTSPHYRRLLLDEIAEQIVAKGFDGVLLDTVGDIEDFVKDAPMKSAQLQAYATLLQELRKRYPSLHLVQNRGFEAAERVSGLLEGFLWEDWDGHWRNSGWMILRVKQAKRWRSKGMRIFTLSRSADALHAAEAGKLGFVHHARPNGYNDW